MKKILLLTIIAFTALQMQAQRLYVQYKFNPELQTLLENPDKKALYETYAAQPINATDRAEYTAVQLRFTDDTGTHELARYSLSPSRLEQLWSSLYDAGRLPFVSTEEDFLDLNDPHFVGLTAESFNIISRLADQLAALPIDARLATIDNFLRNEFECNKAKYTSLLSLALQLIKALDVMGAITLQQEIATLIFTREYLDFHSDWPERLSDICQASLRQAYTRRVLWPTARLVRTIDCNNPFSVKFSPNQQSIVLYPRDIEFNDITIYVFDTINDPTLNHARKLTFNEPVRAASFSPDSNRLAVASDTVSIWKLTQDDTIIERECVLSLNGVAIVTDSIKFSPDGRFILAASLETGNICIWDLSLGSDINNPHFVRTFHVSDDVDNLNIWKAVFSHDGKLVATGVTDSNINQIYVFDLTNPNIASEPHNWRILDCNAISIDSIHFSPSDRHVIARSQERRSVIFDLRTTVTGPQPPRWTFEGIIWKKDRLFFSPGERYIIAIKDNQAHVYDAEDPDLAHMRLHQHIYNLRDGAQAMHVRTNPYHSISSVVDNKVLIWAMMHGEHFDQLAQLTVDSPLRHTEEYMPFARISPLGTYICAIIGDSAYFWQTDKELEALTDKQKLFMLIAKITPDTCLDDACTTYWKSVYDTLPVIAQKLLSSQIRNSFEHQSTDTHTSDKLHEQQLADSFLLTAMKYARKDVDSTIGTGEFWQSETPAKQRKKYDDKISSQEADTMINAFFDSKASTPEKTDASNLTIMQEQMADLIKRKNFEAAEMLFEKYQKDIRASSRYAEFAQAIAEWRTRNGKAGSSSSSNTDR